MVDVVVVDVVVVVVVALLLMQQSAADDENPTQLSVPHKRSPRQSASLSQSPCPS